MAVFERILLTGGAGFVGSYLAPLLAADYPRARRALLTLNDAPAPVDAAWTPVAGDLLDAGAIDEIVASLRPDLVVHLAGQASIGRALDAAEQTWRANFFGSFNLASALARHAPETLALFASSVSVYGASLNDGVAAEDAPPRPLDAYGRSKIAAEGALADVLGPRSRLVIARPVNHSGPRQSEKSFVLSSFAAQIAAIEAGRKQPELRVGDLSKARDFLDVRDVVAAYRALIAQGARTAGSRERLQHRLRPAAHHRRPAGSLARARDKTVRNANRPGAAAPLGGRHPHHRLRRDQAARNHRLAPAAYDRRYAAIAARLLARGRERRPMTEKAPERDEAKDERIRLLEYQLDYLRAELSQLVRERDKIVYSAAWHVFKPLRRIEARLVDAVTAAWRRFVPPAPPSSCRGRHFVERRGRHPRRASRRRACWST